MLGRYTTGPCATAKDSRCASGAVAGASGRAAAPDLYSAAACALDRPPQRHRHPPDAGDAPGDGRGRAGRRRLRRRPDRQRPRGACRRAARQGGRPLRRLAARWATSSPRWPTWRAGRRRSPGASTHMVDRRGGRPRRRRRDRASAPLARPTRTGPSTSTTIEEAFRDPTDPHEPITGLVTIENTHAHSMGQPLTPRLHARRSPRSPTPTASRSTSTAPASSNAVVALGRRRRGDLAEPADSVTFCLSKGLACPVGSIVVGVADVHPAGPARPQAGRRRDAPGRASSPRPGSSPCATAPTGMIDRLAEDHANARRLAEGLAAHGRHRSRPAAWPSPRPGRWTRAASDELRRSSACERDRAAFLDGAPSREAC